MVAFVYALAACLVSIFDAIICFLTLREEAPLETDIDALQSWAEINLYVAHLLALSLGCLIVVLSAHWLAFLRTRIAIGASGAITADLVGNMESRFFSTLMAQISSTSWLLVLIWWSPRAQSSVIGRFVLGQTCMWSAGVGLWISFARNFPSNVANTITDGVGDDILSGSTKMGPTLRDYETRISDVKLYGNRPQLQH